MTRSRVIHLAGGLGNQLFQLTFGLAISEKSSLILEQTLGHPRRNHGGEIELSGFTLPPQVKIASYSQNRFLSKLLHLQIKASSAPSTESLFFKGATKLTEIFIALRFKILMEIFRSEGVGLAPAPLQQDKNYYCIGYFQTYKWFDIPRVQHLMREIRMATPSPIFQYYKNLANEDNPIVIHVRRGDYKNEPGIGLVGKDYYQNATSGIPASIDKDSKFWVFSDEINLAREVLSFIPESRIRFIEDTWDSSVLTMEIMRLGRGFILANSTFGYWAAHLAFEVPHFVMVPDPWFQNSESPKELIPLSWTKLPSHTHV
jgi:hypothetical protein